MLSWLKHGAGSLLLGLCLAGCQDLPNLPPDASFVFSPVSPIVAGETTVVFNAAASRDDDGQIRTYVWNFGDGSPEQSLSAPTVTYVFPDTPARCLEVQYTVQLTVVDDAGDTGFASERVRVIELPTPGSAGCRP